MPEQRDLRSGLTRRAFLGLVAGGGSAALLAGCEAPPAAPAAPTQATAAAPGGTPAASPATFLSAAEWERILAEAKREGTVTVYGAPIPDVRRAVTEGFERAHGIKLDYVIGPPGEIRQRNEQELAANRLTIDVHFSGVSEPDALNYLPQGRFESLSGKLTAAAADPAVWKGGRLKWVDNEGRYLLQTTDWVMTDLFANTRVIPANAIASWRDLLKPEYKGKIAAWDPRIPGPGIATGRYLLKTFGDQYARDLFLGQAVTLTRDVRQIAEWIAREVYPIGLGLDTTVERFRAEGFPVERVFPADGPGSVLGGWSVIRIFKGSIPHPNGAIVYVNWLLSKEGQEIYTRAIKEPSLRTDVGAEGIPAYLLPRSGVNYPDQYTEDWLSTVAPDLQKRWNDILGR